MTDAAYFKEARRKGMRAMSKANRHAALRHFVKIVTLNTSRKDLVNEIYDAFEAGMKERKRLRR